MKNIGIENSIDSRDKKDLDKILYLLIHDLIFIRYKFNLYLN